MAFVHVPYTVLQDETGWYCAHATFVNDEVHGGANGEGATPEEAMADLKEALRGMIDAFGPPRLRAAATEGAFDLGLLSGKKNYRR